MIKQFGKRIAVMAVAAAVCVGLTSAYGVPNIRYQEYASDTPVILTVGGHEVHQDEWKSYLATNKGYIEMMMAMYGFDGDIWADPTIGQAYIEQLYAAADQQAVYLRVIADEFQKNGLHLTREQKENAAAQKKQTVDSMGGQEGFDAWLQSIGMSEKIYDNTVAVNAYIEALYDYYYGENGVKCKLADQMAKFNETYLCAKHILLRNYDDLGQPLSEEQLAEKRAQADAILAELEAGADFDALVNKYNEDPGMQSYPTGYVFTEGEMVTPFYEGAKALEVGQISGVVESEYGYHIIQRCALTEDDLQPYQDAIIQELTGTSFDEEMTAMLEAAETEHTEAYGTVDYDGLQALMGTQETAE